MPCDAAAERKALGAWVMVAAWRMALIRGKKTDAANPPYCDRRAALVGVAWEITGPRFRHCRNARADPDESGALARFDYEYQRNGTADLFMMFAPLEGWRHVKVTDRQPVWCGAGEAGDD